MAWKVLLVIEGPDEPTTYDYMLKPTVDFFARHDPGGAHLNARRKASTCVHQITHRTAALASIGRPAVMFIMWSTTPVHRQ
jgi:hypothetical protein